MLSDHRLLRLLRRRSRNRNPYWEFLLPTIEEEMDDLGSSEEELSSSSDSGGSGEGCNGSTTAPPTPPPNRMVAFLTRVMCVMMP